MAYVTAIFDDLLTPDLSNKCVAEQLQKNLIELVIPEIVKAQKWGASSVMIHRVKLLRKIAAEHEDAIRVTAGAALSNAFKSRGWFLVVRQHQAYMELVWVADIEDAAERAEPEALLADGSDDWAPLSGSVSACTASSRSSDHHLPVIAG